MVALRVIDTETICRFQNFSVFNLFSNGLDPKSFCQCNYTLDERKVYLVMQHASDELALDLK